jgi:hypothetical protein
MTCRFLLLLLLPGRTRGRGEEAANHRLSRRPCVICVAVRLGEEGMMEGEQGVLTTAMSSNHTNRVRSAGVVVVEEVDRVPIPGTVDIVCFECAKLKNWVVERYTHS